MSMTQVAFGAGLAYQAVVRWIMIMGCCCCNRWAARVTREISPIRIGVVRALARSDHWRWVSTPQVGPGPGTSGKPGEQPVADQSRLTNTLQNYIQWAGGQKQTAGRAKPYGPPDQYSANRTGRRRQW